MAYQLRMPAELGDWLAELRESQPVAATEVAASLLALMHAAALPCPPLALLADSEPPAPSADDPREAVDDAYQQLLGELQAVRRRCADAATTRDRAERRLSELTDRPNVGPTEIGAATREVDDAGRREERLARHCERLQVEVDRFRTSKETAKAAHTAADATAKVHALMEQVESGPGEADVPAPEQLGSEAGDQQLRALLAQALRLRRAIRRFEESGDTDLGAARSERVRQGSLELAELLQLRADSLGADIRILFAVDPPGTATLLTVLEGPQAIADDWDDAADAAIMFLMQIRDSGWPPYPGEPDGGGLEFEEPAAFLANFFSGADDALMSRAAAVAATGSLADLRSAGGMSLDDLARATGLGTNRLEALEKGEFRNATLHELTAYLRALGGSLTVTAEVRGAQRRLS